jgi:hypothetical protein
MALKKQIPCASCKRRCLISSTTLYQTHWHIPPRGCSGGDYWKEGECQFICKHCNVVNRLLADAEKENVFKSKYSTLFKEVVKTHDDELIPKWDIVQATMYFKQHGKLPTQNWVNNYWINKSCSSK